MPVANERLSWKLRRIAARLRQRDVAGLIGMSTTRYSAIERGDASPTNLDRELLERHLPQLPVSGSLEKIEVAENTQISSTLPHFPKRGSLPGTEG